MSPPPILSVPDHAVLRFLERVDGLNVEQTRRLIRHLANDAFRAGLTYASFDGFKIMLKGGVVTTILAPGMGHNRAGLLE